MIPDTRGWIFPSDAVQTIVVSVLLALVIVGGSLYLWRTRKGTR